MPSSKHWLSGCSRNSLGYFNSIKKTQAAMKVALCEIKKNLQGINSDRKETRTQINNLEEKEDINIQLEQNKEKKISKQAREA